jgi:hypothetical protein
MQEISDGNVHGGDCRILGVSSYCVFLRTLHSRLRSYFFSKIFFKNNFPLRINYSQIIVLKGDEEMVIRRSTTESMN